MCCLIKHIRNLLFVWSDWVSILHNLSKYLYNTWMLANDFFFIFFVSSWPAPIYSHHNFFWEYVHSRHRLVLFPGKFQTNWKIITYFRNGMQTIWINNIKLQDSTKLLEIINGASRTPPGLMSKQTIVKSLLGNEIALQDLAIWVYIADTKIYRRCTLTHSFEMKGRLGCGRMGKW